MGSDKKVLYACPCCGNLTLEGRGHYDICPVCFWEDDPIQSADESYDGGANEMSLHTARSNYREFGAVSRDMLPHVRKPTIDELTN
jgi:hypothetical protein